MNKELIKYLTLDKEGVIVEVTNYLQVKPRMTHRRTAWYYHLGNIPAVLVAHIDTVRENDRIKVRQRRNKIYAEKCILGADDRAGVLMATLLAKELGIDLLLTDFEETGGIGAWDAAREFEEELREKNIFIEFDRAGFKNYVQYSDTDKDDKIEKLMQRFGIKKEYGSYSDVATLSDRIGVGHVNLSVAYYHQHSPREYVDVKQFQELFKAYKKLVPELAKIKTRVYFPAFDPDFDYYSQFHCPYCGEKLSTSFQLRGRYVYQCDYCGCIIDEVLLINEEVVY